MKFYLLNHPIRSGDLVRINYMQINGERMYIMFSFSKRNLFCYYVDQKMINFEKKEKDVTCKLILSFDMFLAAEFA